MTEPFRILGVAGSLRLKSFNRALLRVAVETAPAGIVFDVFDLAPIPLYNEDVRTAGEPAAVADFKRRIAAAHAVLIATPEYNYSMPGVLKNAFDWVSRPPAESPMRGKPVAIMGASNGGFGTVRSQIALRSLLHALGSVAMPRPELMALRAAELVDAEGNVSDAATRESVGKVVVALQVWAAHFAAPSPPR
jgi:chromate reductase